MSSPNMNLNVPTVGVTIGPNWALQINQCLDVIDQHNHASGNGVQITPAGMNINTDLSLGSNNATNARSVRFTSQGSAFTAGADIGCIYVYGADLYYRDTASNNVRLTIGGAVAGTPGSIGGLVAPASVTYVPANQTYVFESNVNTAGAIDCGPLYLRNIAAASNYIQISPPAVLPANYTITLPSALPAASKIVRLDNLGNLSASLDADNTTIEISSNNLQVKDLGITSAKLASSSVTNAKMTANSVDTTNIVSKAVTNAKKADPNISAANIPNFVGVGPAVLVTLTLTTSASNSAILVQLFATTQNGKAVGVSAADWLQFIFTDPSAGVLSYFVPDLSTAKSNASFMYQCTTAGVYTLEVYIPAGSGFPKTIEDLRVVMSEYR